MLPSAWTIRRQAVLAVGGFDESLQHSEDVDLLLRLANAGHQGAWIGRTGALSDPLRQRQWPAEASAAGLLKVLERHLGALPASDSLGAEQRYGTTTWAVWQAWHAGDPQLALELLARRCRIALIPWCAGPCN